MPEGVLYYIAAAIGVAISVILPLIRPLLPKPAGPGTLGVSPTDVWLIVRPYVVTAIFSLIVAFILLAFLGDTIKSWQAAFLAGYTADSTLQKITTGNT